MHCLFITYVQSWQGCATTSLKWLLIPVLHFSLLFLRILLMLFRLLQPSSPHPTQPLCYYHRRKGSVWRSTVFQDWITVSATLCSTLHHFHVQHFVALSSPHTLLPPTTTVYLLLAAIGWWAWYVASECLEKGLWNQGSLGTCGYSCMTCIEFLACFWVAFVF